MHTTPLELSALPQAPPLPRRPGAQEKESLLTDAWCGYDSVASDYLFPFSFLPSHALRYHCAQAFITVAKVKGRDLPVSRQICCVPYMQLDFHSPFY